VPPPVSLVLIIFTLFFIGFGCVILKFISYFGWSQLAKRYSTFTRPEGASHHWQSMSLGRFLNYSRCITFRISENGLYVEVFPLLSLGHPPLYFPWSHIRFRKEAVGLFGKNYLYDLGTPRGGRMAVQEKMHRVILREIQGD